MIARLTWPNWSTSACRVGSTTKADVPAAMAAPTATAMKLHVYDAARSEIGGSPFTMTRGAKGVWEQVGDAKWVGGYYLYEVTVFHPVTGKIEAVLGLLIVGLHVFTPRRRPEDEEADAVAPAPPGPFGARSRR